MASLKERYPWPETKPEVRAVNWALDGGGKDLVIDRIKAGNFRCIVEVGVFFGGSVRIWLENCPDIQVIAIDPWDINQFSWSEYAVKNGKSELAEQLKHPDGPFHTFLASLWDLKDRIIPVRGRSPAVLYELAELGIQPDLIFFDSDKSGNDLVAAHSLFPDAILAGDDWTWGRDQGYPIRRPVLDLCTQHGYRPRTRLTTWIIDNGAWSRAERFTFWRYRCLRAPVNVASRAFSISKRLLTKFF